MMLYIYKFHVKISMIPTRFELRFYHIQLFYPGHSFQHGK